VNGKEDKSVAEATEAVKNVSVEDKTEVEASA